MKKTYGVVNALQFQLTFIPQRPKSCIERVSTKTYTHCPDSKENHEKLRRCKSQQEISLPSSAETNKQRLSSHECLALDPEKISNGIRSQQILISSALRRPHASFYSLLDSQSTPEPAKPRRPSYRPKSASTVYSYAERPVSASETSRHLGRPTKASLLRSKSSYDIRATSESPRPTNDKKIVKKPCAIRNEYILHKNSLTPKEVFDYMKSVHAYLTGARYNRSRLVDAKSLTKHGLYVSKDGFGSFILDKTREMSSDIEHDVPKAALKVVESQTSQADVMHTGTNTEPYYLSLNKWHCAEWNQGKKHLPPHRNNQRRPISPNKVKPIKARYIDYNTIH
ncbi:uncharacterized protein LOC114544361 [Dendronephthya gigantea]|uniref:uncharacterized protein LOC114527841 n=1 Tax=Dendronephthya gigantea TaxID=151771 RepID=UPI00106CC328|nr:uncharacterized protein LOC114527841 [Dendronephthya gigantea]XP_028418815.1 uncharacterized protein LOC114544361 [Dendronephthya gigantea]